MNKILFTLIFLVVTLFILVNISRAEEIQTGIVINEIFGNPSGSDEGKEWIEIYNNSEQSIRIENWKFINTSTSGSTRLFSIPSATINPYSYLVLSEESFSNVNFNFINLDLDIYNSGGKLEIYNNQDQLIDTKTYEIVPDGKSIELDGPACNNLITNPQSHSVGAINFNYSAECWGEILPEIKNINFTVQGSNQRVDSISSDQASTFTINFEVTENYQSVKFFLENGKEVTNPITLNNYFGKSIKVVVKLQDGREISKDSDLIFIRPNIIFTEIYPSPNSGESEWLEIYNLSSENVDLSGWYFSEEVSGQLCTPTSIKLEQSIESSNHLVINSENFSVTLNNSGDEIYLCNEKNFLVTSVTYPEIKKGNSYSRVYLDTHGDNFIETSNPTPNSSTAQNQPSQIDSQFPKEEISKDPGLYSYTSILGASKNLNLQIPSTSIIKLEKSTSGSTISNAQILVLLAMPIILMLLPTIFVIYKNRKSLKIIYDKVSNKKLIKRDYFKNYSKNAKLFS